MGGGLLWAVAWWVMTISVCCFKNTYFLYIFTGHPFDTLKVRQQALNHKSIIFTVQDCVKQVARSRYQDTKLYKPPQRMDSSLWCGVSRTQSTLWAPSMPSSSGCTLGPWRASAPAPPWPAPGSSRCSLRAVWPGQPSCPWRCLWTWSRSDSRLIRVSWFQETVMVMVKEMSKEDWAASNAERKWNLYCMYMPTQAECAGQQRIHHFSTMLWSN